MIERKDRNFDPVTTEQASNILKACRIDGETDQNRITIVTTAVRLGLEVAIADQMLQNDVTGEGNGLVYEDDSHFNDVRARLVREALENNYRDAVFQEAKAFRAYIASGESDDYDRDRSAVSVAFEEIDKQGGNLYDLCEAVNIGFREILPPVNKT